MHPGLMLSVYEQLSQQLLSLTQAASQAEISLIDSAALTCYALSPSSPFLGYQESSAKIAISKAVQPYSRVDHTSNLQ